MEQLLAVTRVADHEPSHADAEENIVAFSSPRRSVWGTGSAAQIHLPAPWPENVHLVAEALSQIQTLDEVGTPGSGPVAFGALPFDRSAAANLVIPQMIYGHTAEGSRWRTEIAPAGSTGSSAVPKATVKPFLLWTLQHHPPLIYGAFVPLGTGAPQLQRRPHASRLAN
jgi:menaquinone-specific isochorismate synthase